MIRILIADDHDETRSILRVLLQQHQGWEVCGEAATGSEALAKCIDLKPDVLVKDWVMPGMDNFEVAKQVSKLVPETAIVVFTFFDLPDFENVAKAAGVHKVATKNLSSLLAAIEDVLRSRRNRLTASKPGKRLTAEERENLNKTPKPES